MHHAFPSAEPPRSSLAFTRADLDQTLSARFEHVASALGARVALTGGGRRWTFAELDAHANRIAHAIRSLVPDTGCVACLFEHSPEVVIATLGVLKAGHAYLILHSRMPLAGQAAIVQDIKPRLLLTNAAFEAHARELAADRCSVITLEAIGDHHPATNPGRAGHADEPSSVFYTSGTTGQPKGVVRSHRAVLHRVWLSTVYEQISPDDRHSLLTHCSFAASQSDVFGALLLGARLCVFDVVAEGLPSLGVWLEDEAITIFRPAVVLFRRFLDSVNEAQTFPVVRLVALGGDVVSPADLERWKRRFPRPCVVHHRLNTTETTLLTLAVIDHDTPMSAEALAGAPVPDKALALIDEHGRAVPAGDVGELVVTSAFIAGGYWHREEDSRRVFAEDPQRPGQRVYRTGDLGRVLPDGRLLFLGRRDRMVKIRGHRVEIREVEDALRQLLAGQEAAVVALSHHEETMLVAFVVAPDGLSVDGASLRQRLATVVPEWKIPTRFHPVASMPTTLTGKIDYGHLREEAESRERDIRATTSSRSSGREIPTDALERDIADLFKRSLGVAEVFRDDDFFLLGGDSLKALLLHLQLERLAQRLIPVDAAFASPTVAGLAEVVRGVRESDPTSAPALPSVLVPLRRTGTETPMFLVHGREGRAFLRPHLLTVLGPQQPVYAFQAVGLDRSKMPRLEVEAVAHEYVRAMQAVSSRGPYFIAAACSGATIALAMAGQLSRAGETVGPLLLIDPPRRAAGDRPWWSRYRRLVRAYARRWIPLTALATSALRSYRGSGVPSRIDVTTPTTFGATLAVALDLEIARLSHKMSPYDGAVLLLRSSDRIAGDREGRGGFTRYLTGTVRTFEVGRSHADVQAAGNLLFAQRLQEAVSVVREALAVSR